NDNDNNNDNDDNDANKTREYNVWTPFTDNDGNTISIGRKEDNYWGARSMIGGSNDHLLFIAYRPKYIDVFDLNTCKCIKRDTLPIRNETYYHCFVPKIDNGFEKKKKNTKMYEMVLFCRNTGISIKYDEDRNEFQFDQLRVCFTMRPFYAYAYIYVDDFILFFGGEDIASVRISKDIHKYSLIENKWKKLEQTLPIPLGDCVGALTEDNKYVHIFGEQGEGDNTSSVHMKIDMNILLREDTEIEKQWIMEEEEKREIEEIKMELDGMKQDLGVKKPKKQIQIEIIIEYWVRSLFIKLGWIADFTKIITQYILVIVFDCILFYFILKMKYYKLSKEIQMKSTGVNSVQFSPDNTKIVSSFDDKTIRIWDIKLEREIKLLKGHSDGVNDSQFTPDGNKVLSCSEDNTIRLWDVQSGKELMIFKGHLNNVTKAQLSPDGNIVISSSNDQTIIVWEAKSGKNIMTLGHSDYVNSVKFSPTGKTFVSASNDRTIRIWDVTSGTRVNTFEYNENILDSQFSPDCCSIVSCSNDETIQIWDIKAGKIIHSLREHSDIVTRAKYLPDGQTVVSGSNDKTIRLWDLKFGMEVQTLFSKKSFQNKGKKRIEPTKEVSNHTIFK
ncbi:G-protein beta WD-40 repeats containing protein, partial [Reticulomyxa filosa]